MTLLFLMEPETRRTLKGEPTRFMQYRFNVPGLVKCFASYIRIMITYITIVLQIRSAIEQSTSDYDKEKLQERLAKLSGGVAVLKVDFMLLVFHTCKFQRELDLLVLFAIFLFYSFQF